MYNVRQKSFHWGCKTGMIIFLVQLHYWLLQGYFWFLVLYGERGFCIDTIFSYPCALYMINAWLLDIND